MLPEIDNEGECRDDNCSFEMQDYGEDFHAMLCAGKLDSGYWIFDWLGDGALRAPRGYAAMGAEAYRATVGGWHVCDPHAKQIAPNVTFQL